MELQSGNADVIYGVPPANVADLDSPGLAKLQHRGTGASRVVFKVDTPQFSDTRVRQALNYAVDKQGILTGVMRNVGYVMNGPLIADMFGYNDSLQPYPYDRRRPTTAEGRRRPEPRSDLGVDQRPLPLRQGHRRSGGGPTVEGWREVNANFLEFGTWIQQFNKMGEGYFVQAEDTYPHRLFTGLSSRIKSFSWYGYTNSHVDDLIEQGAATFDEAKRRDIYRELDQITRDEAAWLYLFNAQDTFGLRDKVKGFNPTNAGYFYAKDLSLG